MCKRGCKNPVKSLETVLPPPSVSHPPDQAVKKLETVRPPPISIPQNLVKETAVQEENQANTLTEVTLEILDEIIEMISETRDTVKRRKIEDCRDCIEEMEKVKGENCDFCGKGRGYEIH